MHERGDDTGYPVFVRFGGGRDLASDTVVSRSALRLHIYSVLASIESGRPGLVTDDYLNAVTAETSLAAIELCTAGLWSRVDDGYRVRESETMRMAAEVHRQLQELSERCRTSGGHTADPQHDGLCRKCGVQLT